MKRIITIGCCLLITNILLGFLLSKYIIFNICLNSIVIIITFVLIAFLDRIKLSTVYTKTKGITCINGCFIFNLYNYQNNLE